MMRIPGARGHEQIDLTKKKRYFICVPPIYLVAMVAMVESLNSTPSLNSCFVIGLYFS